MRCPFCNHPESRVVDSRLAREGLAIRRRRECLDCESRFTTYEVIEDVRPYVIKKDQRRVPFDRNKLVGGLERACEKRPIHPEDIISFVDRIEATLRASPPHEIETREIGELTMRFLRERDSVSYVRFASVYRSFEDAGEFVQTVQNLTRQPPAPAGQLTLPSDDFATENKSKKVPK